MKIKKFQTTHQFNRIGKALSYGSLAVFIVLLNVRSVPNVWSQIPLLSSTQINDHFSNFSLSFMFMLAFTLAFLNYSKGVWKFIIGSALFMIGLNFITELFVSVENTEDIVDAYAGVLGVFFGILILIMVKRYGLLQKKS